jgi:outer membrane protein TolC
MLKKNFNRINCTAVVRLAVTAIAVMGLIVGTTAAQDSPPVASPNAPGVSVVPSGRFLGGVSPSTTVNVGIAQWLGRDAPAVDIAHSGVSQGNPVPSGIRRRITLEQVKQQRTADTAPNPLARLGQLSIEAAKQHRLGAQADYFPKISTTVANLHFSEFLGQVLTAPRPLAGTTAQVGVPLIGQDQTVVAVTFVQPITPLFQVFQLVKIARADERIAMAKAGVSIARRVSDAQIEEAYFKLLIAQRRRISAEWKLRNAESKTLYASTSLELARAPSQQPELVEVNRALVTAGAEVKELTASLNRMMGWPDDTELDLVPPDPLIENISLQEVADTPVAANPEVIEAEQNAIKARAASVLSKLNYMPTVAAVSGFVYQNNAMPLLPQTFGYGGVMATYNIFDFGKREHSVKEASAQLGMAEIAVQLTKAKVAANVKASYSELERSRQVSQLAQKMGSSVTRLMNVSSASESLEVVAARANVEVDMFEADLAHRQAYARLKALMGPQEKTASH